MDHHAIDDALTDPGFFARGDFHALFRQLRGEDPVHWTQGRLSHGFWSLTKYRDIRAGYSDAATFSSQRGGSILPSCAETEKVSEAESVRYGIELINTDPPRHTHLRKLMDPSFRKGTVRALEPVVRAVIADILEEIVPQRECEFVKDFAVRLPMEMICRIMGVPREDWRDVLHWSDMALGSDDPAFQVAGGSFETKKQGFGKMFNYCHDMALQRRTRPLDDLTSMIATSQIDGDRLSEAELGWNTLMLIMGGIETARNAMSAGILTLWQHPDQMERLAAERKLIPGAVDEILRWSSPATHTRRTATKDVEVGGRLIREGDWVVMWIASANRDEDIFQDPYRFDIGRSPNRHITFGYGAHHCIGRELVIMEVDLMIQEILQRELRLDVVGEVERLESNLVAGIKRLPVRIRSATEPVARA